MNLLRAMAALHLLTRIRQSDHELWRRILEFRTKEKACQKRDVVRVEPVERKSQENTTSA